MKQQNRSPRTGSFPNDDAMFKLLYLALKNISKKWTMPIHVEIGIEPVYDHLREQDAATLTD